jgi:quercetin dioxygenase-like cupin family protein
MRHFVSVLAAFVVFSWAVQAASQDAVEVAPDHYTVELENDEVRVLRISYGPGEKAGMHAHPGGIVVFLTDGEIRFTLPDGTTQDISVKAGQTRWVDAVRHAPENLGDAPLEVIQVEMKHRHQKPEAPAAK